jgi:hypothetical protein
MEAFMQATMRAVLVIAGLGLSGASAVLAAPTGWMLHDTAGLGQVVEPVQYWGGDRCERLRRACVYKEERGEEGEGNCRRYRRECGGY